MKNILIFTSIVILSLFSFAGYSQTKEMKIIRAKHASVDIRDGKDFRKNTWIIEPETKPDVYNTIAEEKRVTFYTDMDSISFDVKPNETYDFIILLNDKDSAWTQIKTDQPNYLKRLKNAAEYNYSDTREIPQWTYQDMNDPNLVKLRQEYNLDSIAGDKDELTKILNLMYWLHDLVPHDGSSSNPKPRNALNILKVCKEEKRGVNCRMLATVLNECYLAMGIKSRFVTCMPKDSVFEDCHVINSVYSSELDKWIWIDPSFAAYVMDEHGNFLGLQEVRERLIDDRPLFLNEDANWNHKNKQTKEFYLDYYMAKNLYRMECTFNSEFDTETNDISKQRVYIELLPLDGLKQSPRKKVDGRFVNYITNNPDLFWAKP